MSGTVEREGLLVWEGCQNARDVGGYETADGRRLRWGALLRSDARRAPLHAAAEPVPAHS